MGFDLFIRWRGSCAYEEGEWRFISRFIKPGTVCFDIGANQGFHTILLSKQLKSQGKVYAFEPVAGELRKLRRNLLLNDCSNVALEGIAVGATDGVTDMTICLDGHGSRSSIQPPPAEVKARTRIEKVPIITLDSYAEHKDIRQLDFVKVDVEGGERDVLRGGENVIKRFRPVMMIEMADITTERFGYPAADNYKFLESLGFTMFEVTLDGLLRAASPKESYRENLIAIPIEKLHMVYHLIEVASGDKAVNRSF